MSIFIAETCFFNIPIETEDGHIILDLGDVEQPTESKHQDEPIMILDICCGAGGLSFGLREAFEGHIIKDYYKYLRQKTRPWAGRDSRKVMIVGVDLDNDALRTYQRNYVGQAIKSDIRWLPLRKGLFDFVVGGVPCQGFSTINTKGRQKKRANPEWEDPRNNLVYAFADIVRAFQPAYFMLENVPGILSYNKGQLFKQVLRRFYTSGYHYEWRLIDAVHYGVPQYRKRVIVLGWMDGVKRWEFPKVTNYCPNWQRCLECGPYVLMEKIKDYPKGLNTTKAKRNC